MQTQTQRSWTAEGAAFMVQLYKEREGVTQLQEVLSSYSLTDGASEPTLIVDAIQFKKKEKKGIRQK